ncbi:MAG TPA: putative Ig domain-containing protein [Terriglobales bacterium]|nr:putative Ig domain-containing protein [Terriglobales bacterium]
MKRVTAATFLSALISFLTLIILTLGLSGCGGSSTAGIGVALTSSSTGIDQGQTASITALVTNDSKSAGVSWSVSGGGTLSGQTTTSATYNAPASVASAFTATVTATSITDATKSASLAIKVNPLPVITTTSLPAATAGTAYATTLTASGGTSPFNWTVTSGSLPLGLSLIGNTGSITGTPTGTGGGSVTFQVKDAAGNSDSRALTITVNPPPALTITTTSLGPALIGVAYTQTLQATGGVPTYAWSVTAGSLPTGLSLSTTGVISGIPSGAVGTSSFTVTVTDSQTPTAATRSANLSIVVSEPPLSVTTTSLAGGSVGTVYNQTLEAIGGTPPYTWSISAGTLPPGLSLSNPANGTISGTPTGTGTSNFTVKVTDSTTPTAGTATAVLSITINTALAITTASLPGGSVGTAYSATIVATGGAQPYSWSITSGTLPAGLVINSAGGVISGTPTATGTSDFTVTVADSESPSIKANAALSITIASAGCPNNAGLSGHYAMMLNGWSSAPNVVTQTVTAAVGSLVADGAGNISSGDIDLNDQINGPLSGTFSGTYCVASNNVATIKLTYSGGLSGTNTFAAALNSSGTNGNIIFYDSTILKASGLLRQQDTSAFSTGKIKGDYAFGLVGADEGITAPRYAMAGAFSSDGSGNLAGEFDNDIYLTGPANATLSSSNFSVASTGRATATITFTGQKNLKFVFYVVSASELLVMEDDIAGSSLLSGQVLQQTGSFTDASLKGIGVIGIESLSNGTTPSATAGLVTTNGTGSITGWSTDQNLGGAISSLNQSGTYTTSTNGRVALSLSQEPSPPVFYLISPNQAFVVGTDGLAVEFGLMEPQLGSNFTASSFTGTYLGGSMQPVDSGVGEEVDNLLANGTNSFTETSDANSSAGPTTSNLNATYAVSPNGRVVASEGGSQVGILYIISATQVVFLPAATTDTAPAVIQLQH